MTTSSKSALISTIATLLSLVVLARPGAAQTYSAAVDFSESSNPNGAWSYGYSYGVGSTFILDTTNTASYGPGLALGGWMGNVDSSPWRQLSLRAEKLHRKPGSPITPRPSINPDNSACNPVKPT